MAQIISISIKEDEFNKIPRFTGKTGIRYVNFDLNIHDTKGKFGEDGSCSAPQTKEQREAKEPKHYIGSAKIVWTKPKDNSPKQEGSSNAPETKSGLPF